MVGFIAPFGMILSTEYDDSLVMILCQSDFEVQNEFLDMK